MTDLHPPPVDRLLTLGKPDYKDDWTDYLALGITDEHVPALIDVLQDPGLSWEAHVKGADEAPFWAPLHAWRALGQLRAEAAAEPLVRTLLRSDDDDWASAEIPEALVMIGPVALGPVRDALPAAVREPEPWLGARLAETVAKIARAHPAVRESAVETLTRQLRVWADQSGELNAFLVWSLMDLRAVESAAVMREAFEAGAVEESVTGDWEDVQVELGLLPERTTPRPHYDHGFQFRPPPRKRITATVPGNDSTAARSRQLRKAQKQGKKKRRR
jgi:hypothetical protein